MKDYKKPDIEIDVGSQNPNNDGQYIRTIFESGETPVVLEPSMLAILIAQLPDNLRIAYVLHDVKHISYTIIANMLWINEVEARRFVHNARLQLRRLWRNK